MTKSESCTVCYLQNSMVSQAELISKGYQPLVSGFISISLEKVWVPLTYSLYPDPWNMRACVSDFCSVGLKETRITYMRIV